MTRNKPLHPAAESRPIRDAGWRFASNALANASQQRYMQRMIVCICNHIKEEELLEVARHGVTDAEEAYSLLGKRPQCRVCLDHAEDVMLDCVRSCDRGGCGPRAVTATGLSAAL